MAVRICSDTFHFARSEEMARSIRRDDIFINLFEQGQMVGFSNGRRGEVSPGGVILSRHGGTQDLEIRDATWFALVLPRQLVDAHVRWTRALEGKVFAPGTTEAVLLGHHLRSLMELPDPVGYADAKRVLRLTIALLTECIGARASAARTVKKAKTVEAAAVRRFLAEISATSTLDPTSCARRSRSHVRAFTGCWTRAAASGP